jgi:uncharacterized protein (TIGR02271 family)
MADYTIRRGMTVYTVDNQSLGTVEEVTETYFLAGGQQYALNSGYRVEGNNVYLTGAQNAAAGANEMRVPVMEEQLNVGKRQAEMGEVQIHKTVTQEQVNVPVELRREEVHVQQVDVNNRPLAAGEYDTAFQEGTIRVPVRGEEAVVNKQAVVTGEVAINKTVTAEQQTIADTVRREHVQVDDTSVQATTGAVQTEGYQANTANYAADTANYAADTAPVNNYSTGTTDATANLREGLDVVGSDGEYIGRVKELRDSEFRVDRKMKPDINVTYSAIQNVNGDQVVLNAPGADFNNFI